MTLERTEGTDTAEQPAPEDGQAQDNAEEPQSSQASAEPQPAETDQIDAGQPAETDETSAGQPAEAGPAEATSIPEPLGADSGTAGSGTEEGESEEASATAADNEPTSADPSPEAAVGASGARPLGDAEEVSTRVADAVDALGQADSGPDSASEDPGKASARAASSGGATPPQASSDGDGQSAAASAAAPSAVAVAVREGPEPTTMEELLNEQPGEIRSLKHGDVVEGTVVRIDKDEILVDIGAKSEGVVSNRELYGRNAEVQPELNIGDTVLVYVLQPESQEGHAVLSLRRAGLERKWRSMQEQFDAGVIIEAPVIDHNKGGLIVDCGIRGFVPISQIVDFPRRPQNEQPRDAAQEIAEKLQPYVGRKLRLKILEVNRKANRLILSEKVALYEERREKRDELFSSLQVGQTVKGTVRSIAPFGVFIDLGGIDGLVHKSELSWNKVNNPEAGYKVGEEVEAEVIDINHERGRISLSIRRLQPDPWHSTVADLKVGDLIDGAVTKIVNFGAFVRVRDGLEGLIHISELSHQRVAHPGDVVHEGQRLKLKVISLDSERHRLGLSLKQAEEAPARPAERERRPRQDRSYDASQAVQEPEGGIDNTLAAAFAQVRQQMEETEAARRVGDEPETAATQAEAAATAESGASVQPEGESTAQPEATAQREATAQPESDAIEAPADVVAEQPDEPAVAAETADAPALEVGAADAGVAATPERETPPAATGAVESTAESGAEAESPGDAEGTPEAGTAEAGTTDEGQEAAAEPVAETSAEPAEGSAATVESPAADEPAMADQPESDQTNARQRTGGRRKAAAEEPAESGEPVADTSAEAAEGAPDAAPEQGADRGDAAG